MHPEPFKRLKSKLLPRVFALILLAVAGMPTGVHTAEPNWKPSQPVELIVGVSPGSSLDKEARLIQKIFQEEKIIDVPVVIMNKPGGGHTIAMTYLAEHARNPHYLLLVSVPLLTRKLMGQGPLTYTDFTPVTQLYNEHNAFAVRTGSPIRSGKDIVDQLRKDPRALSVAIGNGIGNGSHLAFGLAMKAAGVNIRQLRAVTFKGGQDSTLAVLGGHVDILANSAGGNVVNLLKSGKMTVLAVSSAKRLGGAYADVPTWKEQGVDSESRSFRSLLAAGSIEPAQLVFWEQAFVRLAQSEQWKRVLKESYWGETPQGHAESEKFLKTEHAQLKAVLAELGLAK